MSKRFGPQQSDAAEAILRPRTSPANRRPHQAMPETVRVGGLVYRIKPWDHRAADNSRAYGMCDRTTSVILIQDNLASQMQAHVLLHEVLHAAYEAGGLNALPGEEPHEERTVGALTHQLTAIWRDNPELVAYFEEVYR